MACVAGDLAADFGQRLDRHRLVAFVIQVERAAALAVVADHAFERDHRAVFALRQARDDRARIDRLARQREEMPGGILNFVRVLQLGRRRPAAHRRQKRDFIAFADASRDRSENS